MSITPLKDGVAFSKMLLLIFLTVIVSTLSQVATPPRKVGFSYIRGHPPAKVHLEVFLDPICPYSKQTWPNVKDVADYYGPEKVALTVHLFPLPYHQSAFYASRAAFAIHYLTNGTKTFNWIDTILLEKMPELTDTALYNKSDADLLLLFADYVTEMGINATDFLRLMEQRNYNQIEMYTRTMWKHACARGIAGTPSYIVNGIIHPNIRPEAVLDDWKDLIEPMLAHQLFDDIDNFPDDPNPVVTPSTSKQKTTGSNAASVVTQCRIFVFVLILFRLV